MITQIPEYEENLYKIPDGVYLFGFSIYSSDGLFKDTVIRTIKVKEHNENDTIGSIVEEILEYNPYVRWKLDFLIPLEKR